MIRWRAVYIERCTCGSEGGKCKPTMVTWQGGGCPPYSRANAGRSMSDPRNYAYLATLRAIETTNVEFFIFENVVGLLDMSFEDGSSVFKKIKRDYESAGMGYSVTHSVIDVADVGVPQANRLRLIMVGFRKDLSQKYTFDPTTHGPGKKPFVTQKDALWHLANVDQSKETYAGPYDWKFLSRKRQKGWNEPAYTIEASARYAKIHPGYGKMKWISQNKWEIPKECRRLSVTESKLLQTFPEDYIVCGDIEHQYTQIGNAVPPKLAEYIAGPIFRYYEKNVKTEREWLIEKLKVKPSNSFYKSLLAWIDSGKELTEKQKRYVG